MPKPTSSQEAVLEATLSQEPQTARARREPDFLSGQTLMEVTPERKRRRVPTNRYGYYREEEDDTYENRVDGSIYVGMAIRKKFGRKYFRGQVVSGPKQVENKRGEKVEGWHVKYEDTDEEDLEVEELLPLVITANEPFIGMEIRKKFDDGEYYQGQVISGPTDVEDIDTGDVFLNWQVMYEDGQMEDLSKNELQLWAREDGKPSSKEPESSKKKPPNIRPNHRMDREAIKKDLKRLVGITEEEIDVALDKMQPPYGMNKAVQFIHEAKADYDPFEEEGKFVPRKGLKIRKNFLGVAYHGVVTSDEPEKKTDPDTGRDVSMWEVIYDDGDTDDMDFNELLFWRASRPTRPPVRGRQLCALELFSGCSIVTQAFADRRWRVKSIDNSMLSNATTIADIMQLNFDEDVGMVPDFIWASPPCFTYSLLAGGMHRTPKTGQWEKTESAHLHNRILVRMLCIMRWAKAKNPHLIVAIENPAGLLYKMPLMKMVVDELGLYRTTVHYCALGRYDKKPTHIWTNDFDLRSDLSVFTCTCAGTHPIGAKANGHQYNAAAIPEFLAEEVADSVHATFHKRRVRYTKEAVMTDDEKADFNKAMGATEREVAMAIAIPEEVSTSSEAVTEENGEFPSVAAAEGEAGTDDGDDQMVFATQE